MSKDSSKILKPARKLSLGNPWSVILITLAIFFVSQFIAVVLTSVGLAIFKPNTQLKGLLNQSAPVQFFYVLMAESFTLGLVALIVKRWRRLSLAAIGLGRLPVWRDLTRALGGAAAFYGLLIVSSILITLFFPGIDTNQTQDVGFRVLNSGLDSLLAFIALVILPPLAEETLIRGYLYSGLRAHWRFATSMIITSLLFGAAHLQSGATNSPLWFAGINTFLLSLVLVYLRERSGALYSPMLVHAANNLVAFVILIK
jgi:hypothetical protein